MAPHEIRIPRWIRNISNTELSLRIFVDSSIDAYTAAFYLRCDTRDEVTTRFITSKTRVIPLKAETISRCKLIACVKVGQHDLQNSKDGLSFLD
jgi:hypothetical protein